MLFKAKWVGQGWAWVWMMAFWLQLDHWVDNLMGCIKLMTTMPTLQRLNAAASPLWAYCCLSSVHLPGKPDGKIGLLISQAYIDQSYWLLSFLKPTPSSYSKPTLTKNICQQIYFVFHFLERQARNTVPRPFPWQNWALQLYRFQRALFWPKLYFQWSRSFMRNTYLKFFEIQS